MISSPFRLMVAVFATLSPGVVSAASPIEPLVGLVCRGAAPEWSFSIETADRARFSLSAAEGAIFEIVQAATAEGRAGEPLALTAIREGDSVILVLRCAETARGDASGAIAACAPGGWRAEALTQRAVTPILLAGACVRRGG